MTRSLLATLSFIAIVATALAFLASPVSAEVVYKDGCDVILENLNATGASASLAGTDGWTDLETDEHGRIDLRLDVEGSGQLAAGVWTIDWSDGTSEQVTLECEEPYPGVTGADGAIDEEPLVSGPLPQTSTTRPNPPAPLFPAEIIGALAGAVIVLLVYGLTRRER